MSNDLYTNIGYVIVWCLKFIFIPFGVAVSAKLQLKNFFNHSLKDKEKNGLSNSKFYCKQRNFVLISHLTGRRVPFRRRASLVRFVGVVKPVRYRKAEKYVADRVSIAYVKSWKESK